MRVESSKCRIEGNDVVVDGDPEMVERMVSLAFETEAVAVDPVDGGSKEKKVKDGYVVIWSVCATVVRVSKSQTRRQCRRVDPTPRLSSHLTLIGLAIPYIPSPDGDILLPKDPPQFFIQ